MVKLLAIVILAAVAYILLRSRTRENVQKGLVAVMSGALVIYIITIVVTELMR